MTQSNNIKPRPIRIIDWNRIRNGLECKPSLEYKMLSEEAREFFMAENIVDRLDAYADFEFVWQGTKAKFLACDAEVASQWLNGWQENYIALVDYHDLVVDEMFNILSEELVPLLPIKLVDSAGSYESAVGRILSHVLDIVVEANEAKGTEKNAEGKIQKGPDYVPPENTILDYLFDIGVIKPGKLTIVK